MIQLGWDRICVGGTLGFGRMTFSGDRSEKVCISTIVFTISRGCCDEEGLVSHRWALVPSGGLFHLDRCNRVINWIHVRRIQAECI